MSLKSNTMTDGDSMLGLSDNTPASDTLAQSDADSVPTQAPDNQPEGDISSQEGDWYTQAFASNQSSQGGRRENAAMAAQDEQLRSQLLEPKAGDGGDAGASSRQIGQDMGRT